jgi:hypothetical protein
MRRRPPARAVHHEVVVAAIDADDHALAQLDAILLGEAKAAVLGEVAEVLIAGNQCYVVIDTRLCDQCIGDFRFESARSKLRASLSGPLPKSLGHVQ